MGPENHTHKKETIQFSQQQALNKINNKTLASVLKKDELYIDYPK